ncbi:TPA: YkgJ family cysteine cluster protein [Pseudomonas putida]|nr:YkgJ family cysteine cluster protein [Pseudomonas putida]
MNTLKSSTHYAIADDAHTKTQQLLSTTREAMKRQEKKKECGPCNMCCITLKIDEPDLKKDADSPCKNLSPQKGCAIYESRPSLCKNWKCAWLMMPKIPNYLRPDKCGFIIKVEMSEAQPEYILTALTNPIQTLTSSRALELIASCISANTKISINIPTKPGHVNARVLITGYINKEDLISEQNLRIKILSAMASGSKHDTDLIARLT